MLLIAWYSIAGLVERSVSATLGTIRSIDVAIRQFFSKVALYAVLVGALCDGGSSAGEKASSTGKGA